MQKTVYFDKYVPYHLVEGEDGAMVEQRLDMSDFFQIIAETEFGNTLHRINGERYRFHVCRHDENNECWEVQILHLRDVLLPGVADEAGTYEELDLPEGRYLAESCTMMYDANDGYLYMQRNKMCITASRLTDYFRAMFPEGTYLYFKAALNGNQEQPWGNRTYFRQVELCCYADQVENLAPDTSLRRLLNGYGAYQGNTINISISMGHRPGTLNPQRTRELIAQAYQTPDMVKLKVKAAEEEDADYEWLNLLENRATYRCRIEYERNSRISHAMLYNACLHAHMRGR